MSGQTILVVDDDRATVTLLTSLLRKDGYVVVSAMDALQAVQQAQRSQPAAIIMDLAMPAGGGLTAIERLALSARTAGIPVIVLTASDDPTLQTRAMAAGSASFFRKPFDWTKLRGAVAAAVRGGLSGARVPESPAGGPGPAPET